MGAPVPRWTPAHRAWAGYFARLGAAQRAAARVAAEFVRAALKQRGLVLQYFAQAFLRVAALK
eukprot:7511251-Pyramimonas_sp.AAC.1